VTAGRRPGTVISVTVAGFGLVVAACGQTFSGTTLSAQVTNWASSSGFLSSVSTIQADIRRIDVVVENPKAPPLKADCDVLVNDTLMANQNLPSPDLTLTDSLATAYSEAGNAGRDCLSGAGKAGRLLARSATERVTARRDLIKALARYDAVTTP
jgi:hypothetical protein